MTAQPLSAQVFFSNVEDFVAELKLDEGKTVGGIVRVSSLSKQRTRGLPESDLYLLASYLRNGQLVKVEHPVGVVWPKPFEGAAANPINEASRDELRRVETIVANTVAAQGLEIRGGCFEPVGGVKA